MRRYFILNRPTNDELIALESCIGENYTQRYSLDNSQIVIKTNQIIIDSFLLGLIDKIGTEYTLDEIKVIMNNSSWTNPDDII